MRYRPLAALIALTALLAPVHAADVVSDSEAQFLRVKESNDRSRIALQVAAREYQRADGTGPTVALVAVAHLGEASFYRELQKLLDTYDLVLYESVTPPGTARPPADATDADRVEYTRQSLAFLAGAIMAYENEHDELPRTIDALTEHATASDSRLGPWVEQSLRDAWGNAVQYELTINQALTPVDSVKRRESFDLISYGADGRRGGDGLDADIALDDLNADPLAIGGESEDNIQAELATTLGLAFQLNAIDYNRPHWRVSDMSIDQVERSLRDKGSDMTFMSTLTGGSTTARFMTIILRGIRLFDAFTDGAIADMFKVVLIEMLGNEKLIEMSMQQMDDQMGAGFAEVIVNERNQVVIDDLIEVVDHEPQFATIGIFYGAAHMADLVERMKDQLDLVATDAAPQWITAIEVDLNESAVSRRELNQVRLMMRQMMRQQMGQ